MKAILDPEQQQTIDREIVPLVRNVQHLAVKSAEDRAVLVSDIKAAEALKEAIETKFHPTQNKKVAYENYELTLDTEHQFYDSLNAFISDGKRSIKGWDTSETIRIQRQQREEQERKEQAEREERARREAEAKAAQEAEERRQLEEFERLEAEKKKKQELLKSASESGNAKVAGIAAKEIAKIDSESQRVADEGAAKIAEIQAKAEEPAPVMPKFTPPPAPMKKLIQKARVTNMVKFCRSIGNLDIPWNTVEVRQAQLNDFAKTHDPSIKIEGIEFYQEVNGRI